MSIFLAKTEKNLMFSLIFAIWTNGNRSQKQDN